MIDFLVSALQSIPAPLAVLLIAMTPVVELRGAIPVGVAVYHLPTWMVVFLAILGNCIPGVLILYGWDAVITALERRWPWFHGVMSRYHDRLHTKWQNSIDRHGPWALALFVAVPLPLSGVWSGALVAWIFGLHKRIALLSIFIGVVIAAAIVTLAPYLFFAVFPNGL